MALAVENRRLFSVQCLMFRNGKIHQDQKIFIGNRSRSQLAPLIYAMSIAIVHDTLKPIITIPNGIDEFFQFWQALDDRGQDTGYCYIACGGSCIDGLYCKKCNLKYETNLYLQFGVFFCL